MKLLYLWRVLLLPMSNIYKTVLVKRFMHHIVNSNACACGPVKSVINACIKYNLLHYVLNAIENGEYCCMSYWKKLVKTMIKDRHIKQWHITKPLFPSLMGFNQDICKISPWWYFAHKYPESHKHSLLIIQMILNKDRHEHKRCLYCNRCEDVNLCHILFECMHVEQHRLKLWSQVEKVSVPNLVSCLNAMDNNAKCNFIINGFNCNYVQDWNDVYKQLSHFVYHMYKLYVKLGN